MVTEGCQTELNGEMSIDQRLKEIDFAMRDSLAAEKLMPYKVLEERMVKYKRECDERMRKEIEAQVKRVRELEVAQIRIEEAANYRKQVNEFQYELEAMHQEKIKELKTREREIMARCKEREREVESAAFEHRQKVIRDLEVMRVKESEMKKTVEMELMTIRAERESCAAKVRDAELKLKDLERLKIALEKKADNEIAEYRSKYEREREDEHRAFESRRRQLDEDKHMFEMSKEKFISTETEKNKLEKRCEQLLNERDTLLRTNDELKDQNRVFSANSLRDQEIIASKTIEARSSTDEA